MITCRRSRTHGGVGRIARGAGARCLSVLLPGRMDLEEPVHGFGAGSQHRPQLPPVDHLGGPGIRVPREPRDLLDRHPRAGHQRHEGMPQLPWRPVLADLGCFAGGPELPPDVGRVQGSTRPGGEDKFPVAQCQAGGGPVGGLPLPVAQSAFTAISGKASVRRDFSVFVSPCDRTDRHTAALAGQADWPRDRRSRRAPSAAPGPPRCGCRSRGTERCKHAFSSPRRRPGARTPAPG